MPKQHRPGPRFGLSDDALDYVASRNPRLQRGPKGEPNVTRIAEVGGSATPSTLRKIARGELPLSLEALAGMVKASGASTDREVFGVVRRLLVWMPEGEPDGHHSADEPELAAA